jgi:hypothetical protein
MLVFFAMYITAAPLVHAVEFGDIERLRNALKGVWLVGPLTGLLLGYEAHIAQTYGLAGE